MLDLTIAIPTYNGEKRLPLVLEKLRSQTETEGIAWEVLIVDNNSSDGTAIIVEQFRQNWPGEIPLRYVLENQQGAAFARQRAIRESKAELVGFLDDDNIPESNWVWQAVRFAREHPQAGAYGSQIHGIFEAEPPPNFDRIKPFFAITQRGNQPLPYPPYRNLLPPSAGLVVRRQAWIECVPQQSILSGRVPGSMLTGEDLEVLSYIHRQSAWEIWYNPHMQIAHKIPPHRLQAEYLIPFMRGIGLSRYVTRLVGVNPLVKPFAVAAYWVNDLRKMSVHAFKHGFRWHQDLVAACQMELLIGSLTSPFYFWNLLGSKSVQPRLKGKHEF
ncbi:hormogonium polysaccharide biosynthesis glycosyltransferase HpsE [Geitlerinema sp. PCC 9228]|jgi:glycosyltransferase involved in cell wall biosynthesis|uniref:hormogonium polysaccharide biosynthesis glycosyltransferase HpsE n=1 Tax=Geitlerinema sp. PCC 9228 TaxID=111611 RepID=UPI0008F99828|nr:hormogonium polysaccharide biosynthesis glycosyltransferase HpsE [Geitlerinema sp. PCC 9228]